MERTLGDVLEKRVSFKRAAGMLCVAAFCVTSIGAGRVGAQPSAWAEALGADHSTALEASRALSSGGARAVSALAAAWPTLSPKARRRACVPLAKLAQQGEAGAIELLSTAAVDEDKTVRQKAIDALSTSGGTGLLALGTLVSVPEIGDEASKVLATRAPRAAIAPLLKALDEPGGADRSEVRRALRSAVSRAGPDGANALDAWIEAGPTPSGAAACALALAGTDIGAARAERLFSIARDAGEFSTRWRLLRSMDPPPASASVHSWLKELAAEAEPWMLRAEALRTLGTSAGLSTPTRGLGDTYPRVRAAAAMALAGHADALIPLAERARKDPWHLVRAAALQGLSGHPKAVPIFVAAIDDPAAMVRARAIELLAADYGEVDAWPEVSARLQKDTWPDVKAAAIHYAGARCVGGAVDVLNRLVLRAVRSSATIYDVELGTEALAALGAIGSEPARSTLERVSSSATIAPSLRMTAERALEGGSECP